MWNPSKWCVSNVFSSEQLISGTFSNKNNFTFLFLVVYDLNTASGRKALWQDVARIPTGVTTPWLVMDNFNVVHSAEEKVGGNRVDTSWLDNSFNLCPDSCGLSDIRSYGCFYTWNNYSDQGMRIAAKLDRTLANMLWTFSSPHVQAFFSSAS